MKGNQKRDMGKGVGLGNLVPTLFGNTGVAFVRNEPLFFVLMRIQVNLGSLASSTILFLGAILILCGLAGKLGCALGVMEGEVNKLAVAIGMITWGEVGLIFAGIAASLTMQGQPMLSEGMFSAIVLMVLVTTLIGPIGLRWAFRGSRASQG
jgi:Kef-type K+ transport system membrane component KefB